MYKKAKFNNGNFSNKSLDQEKQIELYLGEVSGEKHKEHPIIGRNLLDLIKKVYCRGKQRYIAKYATLIIEIKRGSTCNGKLIVWKFITSLSPQNGFYWFVRNIWNAQGSLAKKCYFFLLAINLWTGIIIHTYSN